MSSKKHLGLKIALVSLASLVVLAVAVIEIAPGTRFVRNLLTGAVSDNIDCELSYSDMDISLFRGFPVIRVTVDSVALTYPHDRFAAWDVPGDHDSRLDAGRGALKDTLAGFDRLTVAVNPWRCLVGRIRIKEAGISGLKLNAHQYDSAAANWNVFHPSTKEKDTTATNLPWISVRELYLSDNTAVTYTDQGSGLSADLAMRRLTLSGNLKLDEAVRFGRVRFDMDSLSVEAVTPSDSVSLLLDELRIREPHRDEFELGLKADAFADTRRWGELRVPVDLSALAGVALGDDAVSIDVRRMDGRIAHIPIHIDGRADSYPDSTFVDARLELAGCPVDTLLREYGDKFAAISRDFSTDALLSLSVKADGVYSSRSIPALKACMRIPESCIEYRPYDFKGSLAADIDADVSPKSVVNVRVEEFVAQVPGLAMDMNGDSDDLLGRNPHFNLKAVADADLDVLLKWLPVELGMDASGKLNINLDAGAFMDELSEYRFDEAHLRAEISGDRLSVTMPDDTLAVRTINPYVLATSNRSGIGLDVNTDTVFFRKGTSLSAIAMAMKNHGEVRKVETRGGLAPRVEFENDEGRVFLRAGANRISLSRPHIAASAQKFVFKPRRSMPASNPDSLPRPRFRMRQEPVPDDFGTDGNLSINLDSTIRAYLRQWNPKAAISFERGFVRTPALPLRTRLGGFGGYFDGDKLSVDSLKVVSGTSDISAEGYVSGLRRTMQRSGSIKASLDLNSERINLNELLAALQAGKDIERDTTLAENDESYILDTLENAEFDRGDMPLFILPANADAELRVNAGLVNYAGIDVTPFKAAVKLQDRTLQVLDTKVTTDLGKIGLSAYYSTKSRSDISAGVDIALSDISADGIIQLLPSVDSLMPALRSFKGKLDCDVSATTQVDTNMNIKIPSLEGVVRISGKNLTVEDAGDLKKITRLLMFKNKNIGDIADLSVNAVIHDGRIEVFPFELGVDRYKLALYGMQGMDKTMYYHASILKSPFLIKFGVNMFGTLDNWRFSLGLPRYREGYVPVYSSQIDTMRINIVNSIRDIYTRGVDEVRTYNKAAFERLEKDRVRNGMLTAEEAGNLSVEEMLAADNMSFEYDNLLAEQELESEVDAVLESSYRDIESMMDDYAEKTYNKGILNRISRLKNKK